ncbi:MAG: hypothetical protein H7Y13_10255 [Sphingobacteriaceae bacterium]|nr:hypothetical protein [Sphingobacteriaceae bacterium]
MADVHSKETRSYNMSRIRSKDTNRTADLIRIGSLISDCGTN